MFKKWLFKLDRVIIWPLLFATVIYLLSGYSLTYRFSAYKIIPQDSASKIHTPFCIIFLTLFLLHFIIAAYFAILRQPSKASLSMTLSRWSAWLLLVSTIIMIISGYSRAGSLMIVPFSIAVQLHTTFSFLVIPLFIVHAGINFYTLIREWVKNLSQSFTRE